MEDVEFEWNDEKAERNLQKHGITLREGATIFNDPLMVTVADLAHSTNEDRYISIGASAQGRLLVVIHTERTERMRLISCRKATSAERKTYENH